MSFYVLLSSTLLCALALPPPDSSLYQGHILGSEPRCESICRNLCDSPVCISSCKFKFCNEAEVSSSSWTFFTFMVVVMVVLAVVLKLVFQKMIDRRETDGEAEAEGYYQSL